MFKGYKKQKLIKSGYLKVDDIHELYYEEYGNTKGIPVIYVHGGPGGSISKKCSYFFDPKKYHIVLYDQRGTGNSKPFLSTRNNNIFYLVEDLKQIKNFFGFDRVTLFGGSFGSTLALAYAIKYPDDIKRLVLRGIFLGRQSDVDWLYKEGASYFYPEEHEKFTELIDDKTNPIEGYYKIFNSNNTTLANKAMIKFSNYEANLVALRYSPKKEGDFPTVYQKSIAFYEDYYFQNHTFLGDDNYILDNKDKYRDLKINIVHGRYDMVCRPIAAYELYKGLNNATLKFVNLAGHSSFEEDMFKELVALMDIIKKEK